MIRVCLASASEIKKQALLEILPMNTIIECIETPTSNPQPVGLDEAIKCVQERSDYVQKENPKFKQKYDLLIIIENYIKTLPHPEDRVFIAIYNILEDSYHISYDDSGVPLPDIELFNNGLFIKERTLLVNEGGFQLTSDATVKITGKTYGELLCEKYPEYGPANNWMKHFGTDRKVLIKKTLVSIIKQMNVKKSTFQNSICFINKEFGQLEYRKFK